MYNNFLSNGGKTYPKRTQSALVEVQQNAVNLFEAKKYAESEEINNEILKQYPDDYLALALKASFYTLLHNNNDASIQLFDTLLAQRNDYASVNMQYMQILIEAMQFSKAKSYLNILIKQYPHISSYYILKARIHSRLQEYETCIIYLEDALKLEPNNISALGNLALAHRDCMNFEQSQVCYKQALLRDPYNGWLNANYTMLLLLMRKYDEAWQFYYARWYAPSMHKDIPDFALDLPYWRPTDSNDDIPPLIIWYEQGLGDIIIFCSMLDALLQHTSHKVMLYISAKLAGLFSRTYPTIDVVIYHPPTAWLKQKNITHHMPMADLMVLYKHNDVFPKKAWLKTDKDYVNTIRLKLQEVAKGKKIIGISWDTLGPNSYRRRMDVEKILAVLHKHNMLAICLQYDMDTDIIKEIYKKTGYMLLNTSIDLWHNVDGVAALIDACDGVLSIANINGHIAGALGKKALILLTYSSDWRWGFEAKSPFYESIHLLRQKKLGSGWDNVLQDVDAMLEDGFFDNT